MANPWLRRRSPSRRPPHDEGGTVLVLWALCLTVLIGCTALVVDLGNLEQQAVNVQDAADSAALAGVTTLAPAVGSLVEQVIPIPGRTCQVAPTNQWLRCKNFSWLDGHYLYDGQSPPGAYCQASPCSGWWRVVAAAQEPGQISDVQVFQDGTSIGGWTCAYSQVVTHGDVYRSYCGALDTGVTNAEANWDLTTALAFNPAITATNNAADMASHYGLSPRWSACSHSYSTGQGQLFLAEGWNGTTCLGYRVAPGYKVVFWAELDVNGISRTAWATGSPARLCSGLSPGQCD
ncbi:MAG: pilus assembly protein TadG-related protein [Acidimicrobiales bacterium]